MTDRLYSGLKTCMLPLLSLGLLASCNALKFKPEYVECPPLSALQSYENVILTGAEQGQKVSMRLNGVDTRCYAIEGGHRMEIDLGLFIRRLDGDISLREHVEVDVTFAYLDADDQVIGRQVREDDALIAGFVDKSRPIFTFEIDVPEGTRVVLGLGRVSE